MEAGKSNDMNMNMLSVERKSNMIYCISVDRCISYSRARVFFDRSHQKSHLLRIAMATACTIEPLLPLANFNC
jgi:hypothetical protein